MSHADPFAPDNWLGRHLATWTEGVMRGAWPILLLMLALAAAAGTYTVRHIGINTDTTDMISADLDWRGDFIEFRESFPILWRSLVVVIDGDSADLAERARSLLLEELRARDDLFVFDGGEASEAFFARQGLLYQTPDQLQALGDRLSEVQPFLGRLARDPNLRGFADMFSLIATAAERGNLLDTEGLLRELDAALEAVANGRFHRFPWLELMDADGEVNASDRRRLILLEPRLDTSRVAPARPAIEFIYELSERLSLDAEHGTSVRLTGPVALEYEELRSVSQGAAAAGIAALVLVLLVLSFGLRSASLVSAALITLLVGLVVTAAFAAFAVGRLNLISVAFAVLYIGLGIDFSVHFCLRYRELLRTGADRRAALKATASDVGASLILCAVTTSIGFYAFVPTAFTGVSELGVISGTGMYISLLANLTLLPALLYVLPAPAPKVTATGQPSNVRALPWPQRHPRLIVGLASMLGALAIAGLSQVRFDPNPLNLRPPESPSVTAYRDLLADPGTSPLILSVLVPDLKSAIALATVAAQEPLVESARTQASFVPVQQPERLALIEELGFIIGPDLVVREAPALSRAERETALASLDAALAKLATLDEANSRLLAQTRAALARLQSAADTSALAVLERTLLAGFAPQLERLGTALGATPVALEGLPDELRARWQSADGRQRLELRPAQNLADNAAMRRFVDEVRRRFPRATGLPVVQLGAGEAVVQAFVQAILTALALITLLLLLLLRSARATLQVMGPVLLASVLTASATVIVGVDFNFANIIALPLLLGMGVDNGIHLVHRHRSAPPADGNLLATSTARAVVFSALTTIVSFGNLAASPHPGTASMGLVLALGLVLILLCTLVVLPAVLSLSAARPEAPAP